MKYHDIYEYLRENYTFIVKEGFSRNTKFFIKLASYCIDDRIIKPTDTCKTIGYFTCHNDNNIVSEDILMLLAKYQLDNEAGIVKTPCKNLSATNTNFPQDKVLIIDTEEYNDVLEVTNDWQTKNYSRNAITTTLGGYSLVHHMYNTEKYENKFVKRAKLNKKKFDQFVMLPSGLKFAWLLHQLNWQPDKKLVLYDVSSFPIAFAKEMILTWDVSTPLHDWAMSHPVAKGILIASGQINEGIRPGAGPKEWDNMWENEIKLWGGIENIKSTMTKLKEAEVNGDISWCTVNMATDQLGQELIFDNLDDTPTVFWLSNIFDSSPICAINATNQKHFYSKESRITLANKWYKKLRSNLPNKSLVIGSVPIINKDTITFTSGELLK